jgi:hypothetical protein
MLRYIVCCLVLAGCASTSKDKPFVEGPIRVSCEARTFEQAKQICFSNAIEFAVGAVVVTETEVRKQRLIKDEILKHSSGYVDDFKIEGRIDEPNRVLLIMDVTVKSSKIAERIMNAQTPTGQIQGERLGAQYSSFIKNKESGDKLLNQVLNDYPRYAFTVEKGKVYHQVDVNRNPVIIVPYKISWNYKYLQALNEALTITQDPSSRTIKQERISVVSKDPKAWMLGKTDTYYFNDVSRASMVKNKFVGMIYVNIKFKDDNGHIVKSGCGPGIPINGLYPTDSFVLNGNKVIEEEMVYTVSSNQHKINKISEVEVSVTTTQCTFVQ